MIVFSRQVVCVRDNSGLELLRNGEAHTIFGSAEKSYKKDWEKMAPPEPHHNFNSTLKYFRKGIAKKKDASYYQFYKMATFIKSISS